MIGVLPVSFPAIHGVLGGVLCSLTTCGAFSIPTGCGYVAIIWDTHYVIAFRMLSIVGRYYLLIIIQAE